MSKSSIEMIEEVLKTNLKMVEIVKSQNKEEQSITVYLVCKSLNEMSGNIINMYSFIKS